MMKLLTTPQEVQLIISEGKRSATHYITNFFPSREKLDMWLKNEELFEASRGAAALILRKSDDFFHVHFSAGAPAELQAALQDLPAENLLVCDLVGSSEATAELVSVFEQAGFYKYRNLRRLVRVNSRSTPSIRDKTVAVAREDEANAVHAILQHAFDRHSEQIPAFDELQAAARQGEIFVVRKNNDLAGFLYFQQQGVTASVRYWFVDERYRNEGIGSKLMHAFFDHTATAKRILLWVVEDNENAIAKYEHYGFAPDNLIDQVMRKDAAK
ncbi:GNAT family N-acetyltransferase [Microvirgula aerodenitrificans]|uniref:GNAT family N-acetyltransferase n=1 Tax=Microvirgula aerodenitrificans TaxID=57480 RepID=UPI00048D9730|nr:GNAT family N-acetyltransferase [Microvirgula aerodenitrificans]